MELQHGKLSHKTQPFGRDRYQSCTRVKRQQLNLCATETDTKQEVNLTSSISLFASIIARLGRQPFLISFKLS